MLMKSYPFLLLLFICPFLYGQEEEAINPDRPDQSEGVYVLPRGQFQIEDGFTFQPGVLAQNLMLRCGLLSSTEIRLSSDIEKTAQGILVDNIVLSAKQRLIEAQGWIPALTLVGYLACDLQAGAELSPDLLASFEYEIGRSDWAFDWNMGVNNRFRNGILTAQLNGPVVGGLSAFAEYYAILSKDEAPSHNVDIGLMYTLSPNFQIDLAAGRGLKTDADYFLTFGFAYRIHFRD